MNLLTCKECKTSLSNLPGNARFCSRKCCTKFRESWRKQGITEQECICCSTKFVPKTRKKTKFCSIKCIYDYRVKMNQKTYEERKCENCSNLYQPTRGFQKYCSPKCGVQFKNTAVKLGLTVNEANREIKELKEEIKEQESIRQEPIPEGMTLGVCSDCGQELKTMEEYLISRCQLCDKINKNKLVEDARKRQFGSSYNPK